MHKPPSELNENLFWLGLSPSDLVTIMVFNLTLYYGLIPIGFELLSFPLTIGLSVVIYNVRRTKRKKFIRDYLLNIITKEGTLEHSSE